MSSPMRKGGRPLDDRSVVTAATSSTPSSVTISIGTFRGLSKRH